ncbi:phenylalanine--tRNA ligase subunit beta [Granulicella sp. WH15]|uniref:phenylalanine--tRNA ligase subunit beta n=1 Tax=Granulicella sp. WH15 TaxID=2602070 RepID=UPI00136701FC|nr:phenylalanine--tRNA ligase subunit beta [Granulicella sp. WH15]QHN02434.1 phenylalanine--tRNA ligase subunit beta [Granulicella sp. WH15]
MKILTSWLRSSVPGITVDDQQLAEDLTLRGIAVEGVHDLGEGAGHLFEMDITTNRVDAMNHYGIAREAATIYDVPLMPFALDLPEPVPAAPLPVRIEAPERCGRFTARVIRGATISPSTGVTAKYFELLGQKAISNAVDATNFTLLGMGQPTHAFDLDKIEGGIVVRLAHAGEQLRLLDGTTRTLTAEDLVIADEKKALSLAGVMGGWDSMITAETKNIVVESAWFEPAGIRASSRRHLIHTDASHRYERGADFNAAPIGNTLVTRHILEACGGQLDGELVDVIVPALASVTADRPAITLSVKQVQRHLGTTIASEGITRELVVRFLTALGCGLTAVDDDAFEVKLPSWRLDLTREIDLIEEVARVYGYNGFANTLPTPGIVEAYPTARAEKAVQQRLLALGYSEAVSTTFASPSESVLFALDRPAIPLENPLNEEASLLRPSLVPGMVAMLAHNLNRDVLNVRLFEAGARFTGSTAEVVESRSLALGLTGQVAANALASAADAPFYELKGVVEAVLGLFATSGVTYATEGVPGYLEATRAAAVLIGGKSFGCFGQLAQAEQQARKLRQPVYLAELDLEALLALPLRHVTARELSRFQAVERDFSVTFSDAVVWRQVAEAVEGLGFAELQRLLPVEVFRDAKKNPGHYSLLLRTVFQSPDRTLREEDLTAWQGAIIAALEKLGGVMRS